MGPPRSIPAVRLDRDVDVGPISLHVSERPGRRGPLVCLPGMTATGQVFDGIARTLAPEWRVLAVDLRGRGGSSRPARGYGYQVDVADVAGLLDRFGFQRPVIVGHGWGAIIALVVAAWYPDAVGGLALIDGGGSIPESALRAIEAASARLDEVYPSLEAYLAPLRASPTLQPWTEDLEQACAAQVADVPRGVQTRTARWAIQQEVHAYRTGPPDFPTLQRAVRCPTLVLRAERGFAGTQDCVLPQPSFEAMLARMPTARGVTIREVSHYTVALGSPGRTIEELRAFVSSL